jgi:uncharacterized protein (DUF983 family)
LPFFGTGIAKRNVKEKARFSALLEAKCPRCKQGAIFKHSAFNYFKYYETNTNCPVCDLRFEKEPAFFTGAMYFSYFINLATIIIIGLSVFFIGNNPALWVYYTSIFPVLLLTVPFVFRYSRVLMLYLFGDF